VDGRFGEAGGADDLVEFVHKVGKVALAFGKGEAAVGRATQAMPPRRRPVTLVVSGRGRIA